MKAFDYLIVGAGFTGCTLAERIASQLGKRVLLLDKRHHIGGNAFDYFDDNGILIHKYGPHIFHTNSQRVYNYLSQFTLWREYQHKVLAFVDGQYVPIPINLDTINQLYGTAYDQFTIQDFYRTVRVEEGQRIENSKDVIMQKVGPELYDKFFRNYTKKQWDLYPEELSPSVCARIPVRSNRDSRYFTDTYQAIPLHGYTTLFQNMIKNQNIVLSLGTSYQQLKDYVRFDKLIFTGPVDEYFEYALGKLPYRSLSFEMRTSDESVAQMVGTINYPNDYEFTRVTEMKHVTGQAHPKTVLVYEYPTKDGEPYYPIPTDESQELYEKYAKLARAESNVVFSGRLGTYKYYNMDQVVAQALHTFDALAVGNM